MSATTRCPYSGCHPPDEQSYYPAHDRQTGETTVARMAICPGCGQLVEVVLHRRWPEGHFPRLAAHDVEVRA